MRVGVLFGKSLDTPFAIRLMYNLTNVECSEPVPMEVKMSDERLTYPPPAIQVESPDDPLAAQRAKNEAAIRLLREWLADESGYDERVWPIVKRALEENRSSYRAMFND